MDDIDNNDAPRLNSKRPRPVVSCLNCRRKKLKCDRRLPCEKCVKSGKPSTCAYTSGQIPDTNDRHELNVPERPLINVPSVNSVLEATADRFDDIQARISQLENALQVQQTQRVHRPLMNSNSHTDLEFDRPYPVEQAHSAQIIKGPVHLSRLGLSIVDQFEAVKSFIDDLGQDSPSQSLITIASDFYALNRETRKTRAKPHAFSLYDDVQNVLAHMEHLLPSLATCNTLIELYFQNFENCTRVLHKPTVFKSFQAYFNGSLMLDKRRTCLPLLLCVVSIAASLGTLPECDTPPLHGEIDGIGAYQLVRNYLKLLTPKQWNELSNVQIAVLSLKFHKSSPLAATDIWHWSGSIVRRAMAAGLHCTSLDDDDIFECEMRRKLWLTVLELDLTFAIAADMPANCPRWQDRPPLNVDDDKIYPRMVQRPQENELENWTDGTCQYTLAQSYNERSMAYSLISSPAATSYEMMLQHTRHLEHIIHDLPQSFRLGPTSDQSSDTPYRLLAKMELDFFLRRPLNACYAPYAATMPQDDRYKEARILWIQGCTYSICFQDLFDPKYPSLELPYPEGLWDFFYNSYGWDARRYLLANCLELQRLRSLHNDAADIASPAYQGHTTRTSVKVMGWNIAGITKSLEDTLDPMARRVGRCGSSLREVARWTAVMGSLRANPSCSRHHAIQNEMQSLILALHRRRSQHFGSTLPKDSNGRSSEVQGSMLKWLQRFLLEEVDDSELDQNL